MPAYRLSYDAPMLLVGCLCYALGNIVLVVAFASWNYQVVRMVVAGLWLEGFGALFLGVCVSFCALVVGRDVGDLATYLVRWHKQVSHADSTAEKNVLEGEGNDVFPSDGENGDQALSWKKVFIVVSLLSSLLMLISLSIAGTVLDRRNPTRRSFWASTIFAPVGAVLRWRLSALNRRLPTFPIGTFIANLTAVLLDVAIGAALVVHSEASTETVFFLSSIITGLGGSLSTVSTWIAEASGLARPQKYTYVLASIACAQLLGIVVYGSTFWIRH